MQKEVIVEETESVLNYGINESYDSPYQHLNYMMQNEINNQERSARDGTVMEKGNQQEVYQADMREKNDSIKSFNPDEELMSESKPPPIRFHLPSLSPKSLTNFEGKKINKNLKTYIHNLFKKDNDKRKQQTDDQKLLKVNPRFSEDVVGSFFDENQEASKDVSG